MSTERIWKMTKEVIRRQKIACNLYVLFKSAQHKVGGLKDFREKPKEKTSTSTLGDEEEAIFRYNFVMNKNDIEIQKDHLREI